MNSNSFKNKVNYKLFTYKSHIYIGRSWYYITIKVWYVIKRNPLPNLLFFFLVK